MGRGVASKGRRDMSGPSWLNPEGEGDGGGGMRMEEEKPKRRRKKDDDDLDDEPKKGIQWKPLAFLVLMVLPGLAPVLLDVFDKLQAYGVLRQMPGYNLIAPSPYRACLQEFYADWAPEKLGSLDDTLAKYENRERQLFSALGKKYGKKVQYERCQPKKEKKETPPQPKPKKEKKEKKAKDE